MIEEHSSNSRQDCIRVFISGRVQGVGYRAWTRRTADGLGLSGWVRNRTDGRVEAVFSGAADHVKKMLAACRTGPSGARVDGIEVATELEPVTGPFVKRPTV